MTTMPNQDLELRAAEERKRLQHTMIEIKTRVQETFDAKRAARKYVKPASTVGAILGLVVGYTFAGMFTRQ